MKNFKKIDFKKYKKYLPYLIILVVLFFLKNVLKGLYDWIVNLIRSLGSSMTDEKATQLSQRLKTAFTNLIPYSGYEEVVDILGGVSLSDYYKIKGAFGLVSRSSITGSPASGLGTFLGIDLNLSEWLSKELKSGQLVSLKELNPNLKTVL